MCKTIVGMGMSLLIKLGEHRKIRSGSLTVCSFAVMRTYKNNSYAGTIVVHKGKPIGEDLLNGQSLELEKDLLRAISTVSENENIVIKPVIIQTAKDYHESFDSLMRSLIKICPGISISHLYKIQEIAPANGFLSTEAHVEVFPDGKLEIMRKNGLHTYQPYDE